MHLNIHKSHFNYTEIHRYSAADQNEPRTRTHTLCEPARSNRNARQYFTRATLYRNLQAECRRPNPRTTLCASLGSRNALQHVTRATLCKKLQEKCRAPAWAQNADTHFVRACAVEMQGNISQEPLDTEIYRPKVRAQSEHPDQAPAFTLTVRTSQCGHTVWGKNMFSKSVLWGKLDGPIWHIIYDYLPIYNWFSIYTIWSSTILNEKRWFGLPYIIICLSYCLPYKYIHNNIYMYHILLGFHREKASKISQRDGHRLQCHCQLRHSSGWDLGEWWLGIYI